MSQNEENNTDVEQPVPDNVPNEQGSKEEKDTAAAVDPQPGWSRKKKALCALLCIIVLGGLICLILWLVARGSDTVLEDYLKILEERNITPESSDEDVRQAMVAMNEFYEKKTRCEASGNVVGVSRAGTSRIYEFNQGTGVDMNEDTLFEIGSISKPVTGLVLAHQISAGLLTLDTPVNDLLPDNIPDLVVQDELVTLRNLVTHTAGFPRLSRNVMDLVESGRITIGTNPYAGFTEQDMLEQITIAAEEGLSQDGLVEYSNFGFSILAYLLGKNANDRPFEEVQQEITDQLNLTSTFIGPIPEDAIPRLSSTNHRSSKNEEVAYWYDGGLFINGGGSTVSSANDMLSLAEILMSLHGQTDSSNVTANDPDLIMKQALKLSLKHLKFIANVPGGGDSGVAFGWFYGGSNEDAPDQALYQHSGGTAGFSTVVNFHPKSQTAIVALANCGETFDMSYMGAALGKHLFGIEN